MSGNVLQFKRPRKQGIRGAARECLTQVHQTIGDPVAVLVVGLARDGTFAVRTVSTSDIHDFDMYARAGAIMDRERMALLDIGGDR